MARFRVDVRFVRVDPVVRTGETGRVKRFDLAGDFESLDDYRYNPSWFSVGSRASAQRW